MIIDTHQHAFTYGKDDRYLAADMDKAGIRFAWLLSWETPAEEDASHFHDAFNPVHFRADGTHRGIPFADVRLAQQNYPDRFVLGYCPHPLKGDAAALFAQAHHEYGVRVCGEWKFKVLLDHPSSIRLFKQAGELGCPVVLHLGRESAEYGRRDWFGGTMAHLERVLALCPETIFIGHATGFWRAISADEPANVAQHYPDGPVRNEGRVQRLLTTYDNLYADLSAQSGLTALTRDREYARSFLIRFADRILFARDYFGNQLHEFLESLELPEKVKANIYYRNALRLVAAPETSQSRPAKNRTIHVTDRNVSSAETGRPRRLSEVKNS